MTVDGANVVATDVQASNGVIHVIDTVLVPWLRRRRTSTEGPTTGPSGASGAYGWRVGLRHSPPSEGRLQMAGTTVVRNPGEGTAYWLLGGLYEVMASSDETGGDATIMQITTPSGTGPPPHTHPGGEAVLVLEGSLRYHIGGDVHEGGPGSFFSIPEGVVENFEATGDGPLKVLVVYTPGGIDRFFAEAGEPAAARELPPPPDGPPDFEAIVAAGARHGINILVPAG